MKLYRLNSSKSADEMLFPMCPVYMDIIQNDSNIKQMDKVQTEQSNKQDNANEALQKEER